ncbi:MAG: hypothetical protein H6553_04860 [Chitinophagales bacterium]|nr:hypothetical protein [Chitinophagales bacterium]
MKSLVLLVMSFMMISVHAESAWEKSKEKDGITIWTRKKEGSSFKEYKGTVVLNTTMDKLLNIFKDIKYHDQIFYKCKAGSVKIVKKNSANDFYTYMVISTPIVKDRDVVTHYEVKKLSNGGYIIELEGAPNLVPDKGLVRVPEMKGYWKFEPTTSGKILVTHQAFSHPGGSVPAGLANSASTDAPFSMLEELRDLVK